MRIVSPTGFTDVLPNRSSTMPVSPSTTTIAILSLSASVTKRPRETPWLRTVAYAAVAPVMLARVVLPP